jgi:hypothetical protein
VEENRHLIPLGAQRVDRGGDQSASCARLLGELASLGLSAALIVEVVTHKRQRLLGCIEPSQSLLLLV